MQPLTDFWRKWYIRAYLWAAELLYGPLAWAYDSVAWLVSFGYWSRWRLDALEFTKPGSVLEIGFGTGELLIALAERGQDVTGLEVSLSMHKITARKIRKNGQSIRRVCGQAQMMPFPATAFDNVVVTFPSNYILKTETLSEIQRVLKRDGRCVVVGLGVQFTSRLMRALTQLWLGGRAEQLLNFFEQPAADVGLSVTIMEHQTPAYILPVVILEPKDAN